MKSLKLFSAVLVVSLLVILLPAKLLFSQECPVGYKKIGEKREKKGNTIIIRPICQKLTIKEIDVELLRLDYIIQANRHEILKWQGKYLPQFQAHFNEWGHLTKEARREVYIAGVNAALSIVLADTLIKAKGHKLILKNEAERIRNEILIPNSNIISLVLDYARIMSRFERADNVAKMLALADFIQESAFRAYNLNVTPRSIGKLLHIALQIVNVATPNPGVHLLISGGEYAVALVYEQYFQAHATDRMNQLLAVRDSQLEVIDSITALYRKRIDERTELRRIRAERILK